MNPEDIDKSARAIESGRNPATCQVPKCVNRFYAASLCRSHYRVWREWRREQGLGRITRPATTFPDIKTWERKHPTTCTLKDCDRPYHSRGLCHAHYEHARRNNALK